MFFMGTLMVVLANQSLMVKYISAIRNVSSSLEWNQVSIVRLSVEVYEQHVITGKRYTRNSHINCTKNEGRLGQRFQ